MSDHRFGHLVVAAAYVTVAIGLAAAGWKSGVLSQYGALLGVFGIVGLAGLVHLLAAVAAFRSELQDSMAHVQDELCALQEKADDLSEQTGALQQTAPQTRDLLREVAILKLLVEELSEQLARSNGQGQPDPPAAQPPSPAAGSQRDIALILKHALKENRIDLYLQPIVTLPSRKTVYYEGFSRVRDEAENIIFPAQYLETARKAELGVALDSLLLFRSISLMRKLAPKRPDVLLFCNLSAQALRDESFAAELAGFIQDNPALAEKLVFELSAEELEQLDPVAQAQLAILARSNCRFSVDHVTSLNFNPAALADANVAFLKIPAQVLLAAETGIAREDFKAYLERHNIALIATHIEDERTVVEILELGIDFGQGYLFGRPKPARPLPAPSAASAA